MPEKQKFAVPKAGVNAVHLNSAREMHMVTARARIPNSSSTPASASSTTSPPIIKQSPLPIASKFQATSTAKVRVPAKSHIGHCSNPQCDHCGAVIIPGPASSLPVKDSPSISVGDWEIHTVRRPILNAEEIDYYEDKLQLPLPEMIFGKNEVRISNPKLNWQITFNSINALDTVLKIGCDPNKLYKVAHSKDWFSHKQGKNNSLSLSSDLYNTEVPTDSLNANVTKMIKPYDWTYTPNYKGTTSSHFKFVPTQKQIPISKLKQPDPILFFDDVVLYEDELADNGITVLQVKIRVMEQRLLLLSRFFLRIDDVVFKIKDVRIFLEFADNLVLRDVREQEDSYADVYKKVLRSAGSNDPRYYLRNSDWVAQHLTTRSHFVEELVLDG